MLALVACWLVGPIAIPIAARLSLTPEEEWQLGEAFRGHPAATKCAILASVLVWPLAVGVAAAVALRRWVSK